MLSRLRISPEPLKLTIIEFGDKINGSLTPKMPAIISLLGAMAFSTKLKIPCSTLQGVFPVRNFDRSIIRSLIPQQAAGNALAIAVQSIISDQTQSFGYGWKNK